MYQALYRSLRPETFDQVVGQEHIVRILKHQLEVDQVSHAYLFCGVRGTGKTTTARLLAKGVNCLSEGDKPCGHCKNCQEIKNGTFMDVVEIDAASNNGIDNIKELRESVKYPPVVGKKKVYIIDEAHMLTTAAANGLLKTLEEPPENVMFILATTEPHKIIRTILSRCMRLDFKRVPQTSLEEHFALICKERGVEVEKGGLSLLASSSDGSVRDGLSLLEQCLAGGEKFLTRNTIVELLGTESTEFFSKLSYAAFKSSMAEGFALIDRAISDGKDPRQLISDWLAHYRALMISKFVDDPADLLNYTDEHLRWIKEQARLVTLSYISGSIMTLSKTINDGRYSPNQRVLLELAFVKIAANGGGDQITAEESKELVMLEARPQSKISQAVDEHAQNRMQQNNAVRKNVEDAQDQEELQGPQGARQDKNQGVGNNNNNKSHVDREQTSKKQDSNGERDSGKKLEPEQLFLIYKKVLDIVVSKTPSVVKFGKVSSLKSIDGGVVHIELLSNTAEVLYNVSKVAFLETFEQVLGRKVTIKISIRGSENQASDDEEIKKRLEEKLHTQVKIKSFLKES